MHLVRASAIATVLIATMTYGIATADSGIPGTVVVAKDSATALIIWDATPMVADIVASKTPDKKAMPQIEQDAAEIAVERAKELGHAADISVRVVYAKSGAVSPVYGTATFEGVERLLTITTTRRNALATKAPLNGISGKLPRGFELRITGALPPR